MAPPPTDRVDVWEQVTDQPVGSSSQALVPTADAHSQLELWRTASVDEVLMRITFAVIDLLADAMNRAAGVADNRRADELLLGSLWTGYRVGRKAVTFALTPVRPMGRVLANPPLVPNALRPTTLARALEQSWRDERPNALRQLALVRDAIVPPFVDAAVQPLDLTRVVIDNVDLEAIAFAVLDRLDLTEVARDRIDLDGLAAEVIDEIDLPEIIRDSTGSVASDTVRSVRMQSIDADQRIQGIVDRIVVWRRGRDTQAPGAQSDGRNDS